MTVALIAKPFIEYYFVVVLVRESLFATKFHLNLLEMHSNFGTTKTKDLYDIVIKFNKNSSQFVNTFQAEQKVFKIFKNNRDKLRVTFRDCELENFDLFQSLVQKSNWFLFEKDACTHQFVCQR